MSHDIRILKDKIEGLLILGDVELIRPKLGIPNFMIYFDKTNIGLDYLIQLNPSKQAWPFIERLRK